MLSHEPSTFAAFTSALFASQQDWFASRQIWPVEMLRGCIARNKQTQIRLRANLASLRDKRVPADLR
jgi:hypothetical protein